MTKGALTMKVEGIVLSLTTHTEKGCADYDPEELLTSDLSSLGAVTGGQYPILQRNICLRGGNTCLWSADPIVAVILS